MTTLLKKKSLLIINDKYSLLNFYFSLLGFANLNIMNKIQIIKSEQYLHLFLYLNRYFGWFFFLNPINKSYKADIKVHNKCLQIWVKMREKFIWIVAIYKSSINIRITWNILGRRRVGLYRYIVFILIENK